MLAQRVDHARGGREPSVEHVGIDYRIAALQGIEAGSDRIERRATVKTDRRLEKRHVELPVDLATYVLEEAMVALHDRALPLGRALQQFKGDGSGLDLKIQRLHAEFEINAQDVRAAHCDDGSSVSLFNPTERRVDQSTREPAAAMGLGHGENPELVQRIIERNR